MTRTALHIEEEEEQYPVEQTVCGTLQRENNWKCFILTSLILACLGAITWCRLTHVTKVVINFSLYPIKSSRQMSACEEGYIYIPVAFMAMLYLVYLVECWHCTARIQLGYRVDVSSVLERVQQMREAQPIVWWKAVCYHYVRRKRQVTRYRNGDAYTSTQVYYERVNSHAAGASFLFGYCGVKDISRKLVLDTTKGPITKIRFSKGFAFANVEAAAEFEEQRARFFCEQERYDDYMEMREGLELANVAHFKEHVIALKDPDRMPWYARQIVFWLCSFCLLSWPLRLLLEYNTAYLHYRVTKLFGVNYENSVSEVTTPSGCVVSGGGGEDDSDSLEWCIRENTTLVPSYSEALLMASCCPPPPPHRPQTRLTSTESWYSMRAVNNNSIGRGERRNAQNRRSLGSFFFRTPSCGSSSSTATRGLTLYYASPLVEGCPQDPFGGRRVTTPTEEEPPTYDEALTLPPLLGRLTRSLTNRVETTSDTTTTATHVLLHPRPSRTVITMETSL